MKTSTHLSNLYENYYDQSVGNKRAVAARQTAGHLHQMLQGTSVDTLLDIGAGEGALLQELGQRDYGQQHFAVEISESGLQAISRRNLPKLKWAKRFDGYRIEAQKDDFDLGLAVHVLEHVEHERSFLQEASRVCRLLYIEVPIELNISIQRAISVGQKFGHINFYTPDTFRNLLCTSGLQVLKLTLFGYTVDYERFVSGRAIGLAKYVLRSNLLRYLPRHAPMLLTYLAGALVSSDSGAQITENT